MIHVPAQVPVDYTLCIVSLLTSSWKTFLSREREAAGGAYRIRILSRARASTSSTSYFCVGQANIMCRKREA